MKKILMFALPLVVFVSSHLYATDMHFEPYVGSAEFQRLKSLAGTWRGTEVMGQETKEAAAEYSVTSNGSAVVEKLFPGTPNEMVTVYYETSGRLAMTHYCAIGNQPQMNLVSANDQELKFDFSPANQIDPAKEMHMHALTLSFEGGDKLVQHWMMYQNGAEGGSTVITLTRVQQ